MWGHLQDFLSMLAENAALTKFFLLKMDFLALCSYMADVSGTISLVYGHILIANANTAIPCGIGGPYLDLTKKVLHALSQHKS